VEGVYFRVLKYTPSTQPSREKKSLCRLFQTAKFWARGFGNFPLFWPEQDPQNDLKWALSDFQVGFLLES